MLIIKQGAQLRPWEAEEAVYNRLHPSRLKHRDGPNTVALGPTLWIRRPDGADNTDSGVAEMSDTNRAHLPSIGIDTGLHMGSHQISIPSLLKLGIGIQPCPKDSQIPSLLSHLWSEVLHVLRHYGLDPRLCHPHHIHKHLGN